MKTKALSFWSKYSKKKKVIILIGLSVGLILIVLAVAFFLVKPTANDESIENTDTNTSANASHEGLADDSEAALSNAFQPYVADKSEAKVKIYSENYGKISSMELTDSCEVELEGSENKIEIGSETLEKPNHCVLHFYGQSETAYILLPDGSLIAVKGNVVIQVNIYDRETRVVQTEGSGYYRIAKQTEGDIFTIQMGDKIFMATGTEIIAHAYQVPTADDVAEKSKDAEYLDELTQEEIDEMLAPNWRIGFGVLEGSGEIITRGEQVKETTSASVGNYFGFDFQEYDKRETKKSSSATVLDLDKAIKDLASDYENRKSMYENVANILESFISDQITISGKYYGIGNFTSLGRQKVSELLTAYLYDYSQISEIQLEQGEKDAAEFYKEWSEWLSAYDGASSSGLPPDSYSGNGSSQSSGSGSQPSSGAEDIPTYYYNDRSSGNSSEQCFNNGTASYQLFCGSSAGGGTVVDGKCCID